MKLIEDDVLDLVAGGGDMQSVIIIGYPDPEPDPWPGYWGPPGYNDPWPSDPGPGDSGGGTPEPPPPCDHSSPDPVAIPAGVAIDALRDMVVDIGRVIATRDQSVEHGALILRTPSGAIEVGPVVDGDANSVAVSYTPGSGQIIAWVHSHPAGSVMPGIPSYPGNAAGGDGDTAMAAFLLSQGYADPAAMMYLYDSNSGDTFEYTMAGTNGLRPLGANITDDTSGCNGYA